MAAFVSTTTAQPVHSKQPNERRHGVRVPSNRPVVMDVNNTTVFATMTDFSRHGLGFLGMCDLQRDDKVIVHFDIPFQKNFKSFCFTATVKHCMRVSEQSHIGVRLDIDENEYTELFDKVVSV